MKQLPVRLRLTFWYLSVVWCTLLLFSLGMFFGMRFAIQRSVDRDLRTRMEEMARFLSSNDALNRALLPEQLREGSSVSPTHDLYQLTDASGTWLYQAPSMQALKIPPETPDKNRAAHFVTITRHRTSIRVLAATLRQGNDLYLVQVAVIVSPLYKILLWFRFYALCTLPVVVVAAGIGGYWLSGRAMKPVNDMAKTAQAISEQSLSNRLTIPAAHDELRHLAETFNGVLSRLDKAFTRITQFTADASHELRTPVAAIRTTAEVILEQPRNRPEYEEMVAQILTEAVYTSGLIENLLTLARADANPASLSKTPIDLAPLVKDIVFNASVLAVRNEVTIRAEVPDSPVVVSAEKQSMQRLMLIILDNAIKYTPPGGDVLVSLTSSGEQAVFAVSDSGIGIAEADLPLIFERFYRASNARDANIDGSGLGLAIAKWIVDAHHGDIDIRSEMNKGTTVRLLFDTVQRREDKRGTTSAARTH